MSEPRHLLITGVPGCGKTTLLVRLARHLADLHPIGFYTEEIRKEGVRQGFRLIGLDGRMGVLAHVRFTGGPRVGRYGVDVAGFETFLAGMSQEGNDSPLVFIDEIGRMECLSPKFIDLVRDLFDSGRTVIATVARRGGGLIAEVKKRADCRVLEVHPANREEVLAEIIGRVQGPRG